MKFSVAAFLSAFCLSAFADSGLMVSGNPGPHQSNLTTWKACALQKDQKGQIAPHQYTENKENIEKCLEAPLNQTLMLPTGAYLVWYGRTFNFVELGNEGKIIELTMLEVPAIQGFFQYSVSQNMRDSTQYDNYLLYAWINWTPFWKTIGKTDYTWEQLCQAKGSGSAEANKLFKESCEVWKSGDYKNLDGKYIKRSVGKLAFVWGGFEDTLPLRLSRDTQWINLSDVPVQPEHLHKGIEFVTVMPGAYFITYTSISGNKYDYYPDEDKVSFPK